MLPYLIGDVALTRLVRIALTFVNDRLHYPLMVEGGKAARLVVQTMDVLIRSVRFQLQICKIRPRQR